MIDIAFCFDENMVKAACVAIASLLDSKEKREHYRIHCICSKKALEDQDILCEIVSQRDKESIIEFIESPKDFDGSYEVRGVTTSTYLRLLLYRLLPEIDKIIYADVDVLFKGSLIELWNCSLRSQVLAGSKGANNFSDSWEHIMKLDYAAELRAVPKSYINAGILVMNLKLIREMNLGSIWGKMAEKNYHYQDQDILNISSKGRITFLPLYYNVPAHLVDKDFQRFYKEGIVSEEECERAMRNPVIVHYTGEKPWHNRGAHKAKLWWDYVEGQEDLKVLFDKRSIKNRKTTGMMGKVNRHLPF